ncbi:MAG TPA: hypothetical protein PK303_03915 [bacterium]|nr:hypothetical protein [bacterium]HOL34806.1 hypothetical protein [bacterium]HPP08251.1 hypothetical protein [bacterium]
MNIRCVWWDGYHNAFTDIAKFMGNFFITFRHATQHAPAGRGEIYVVKSDDGENWRLLCKFPALPDSRDPKLFVFKNKLGVVFFSISDDPEMTGHWVHSYVAYSDDGQSFSEPIRIENYNLRFWRIRIYHNIAYATACRSMPEEKGSFLFASEDGIKFEFVSTIVKDDHANEADLLFENDRCFAFVRREDCKTPVMAVSEYPYKKWERYTTNLVVRGPHIFKYDGKIYCAGRVFLRPDGKIYSYIKNETVYEPKTAILELDTKDMILRPVLILPSGGDTSYCGSIIDNGKLYISYYSQHELDRKESLVGKNASGIYLATIKTMEGK